jgi:dihydrofolate reductase
MECDMEPPSSSRLGLLSASKLIAGATARPRVRRSGVRAGEEHGCPTLGRRTYEIFADYWPRAPEEIPFTGLLNGVVKYVASRTLTGSLAWQGSSLLAGDLAADVAALKERHDEIHVIGSLDLVQSRLRLGVVDQLNVWQFPLLLGRGKQVFGSGTIPHRPAADRVGHPPQRDAAAHLRDGRPPTYGNLAIETDDLQRLADG